MTNWGQSKGLSYVGCLLKFIKAKFMGPTWDPSGADRTQVGPMLAPWTLLSGIRCLTARLHGILEAFEVYIFVTALKFHKPPLGGCTAAKPSLIFWQWYFFSITPHGLLTFAISQGLFCACAHPMRDDVTMWCLLLAGRTYKMTLVLQLCKYRLMFTSKQIFSSNGAK